MLKIIYIYFIVSYSYILPTFILGLSFFLTLNQRSSLQITEIISFLEYEWHICILSMSFIILLLIFSLLLPCSNFKIYFLCDHIQHCFFSYSFCIYHSQSFYAKVIKISPTVLLQFDSFLYSNFNLIVLMVYMALKYIYCVKHCLYSSYFRFRYFYFILNFLICERGMLSTTENHLWILVERDPFPG